MIGAVEIRESARRGRVLVVVSCDGCGNSMSTGAYEEAALSKALRIADSFDVHADGCPYATPESVASRTRRRR